MLRVLVTGSRDLKRQEDRALVFNALNECAVPVRWDLLVIHGACPTGADRWANEWAIEWAEHGVRKQIFPARWNIYGKAAGPLRNQEMVNFGADVCLAFPLGISKGTRDCMERAQKAGIPVYEFSPRRWGA